MKGECAPAIEELKAYQRAVPVAPDAAQVTKLVRDCEQTIEENRKAAEAAKQMQAEAERQKAAAAKEGAAPPAGAGRGEGDAPRKPQARP